MVGEFGLNEVGKDGDSGFAARVPGRALLGTGVAIRFWIWDCEFWI